MNGEVVKSPIDPDDIKTTEFAMSYQWHAPALNLLEQLLDEFYPDSTCYIDIGANLGLRSLLSLSSGRYTIMFEPNPVLNKISRSRAELNNYDNFLIIEKGVSDRTGERRFYVDSSSYLSSLDKNHFPERSLHNEIVIQTITLDEYIESITIESGFYAKIDVEGHEWEVIQGSLNCIKNYHPTFIIEINKRNAHIQRIFLFFYEISYRIFSIAHKPKKMLFLEEIHPARKFVVDYPSNDFLMVKNTEIIRKLTPYIRA
ncbi:FkbM family methyltransferase [Pseudomonadota bacterium]